jgi:AraC-like DNA-binding protein
MHTDSKAFNAGAAIVRVDALRKFHEIVADLGGDARQLLAEAQIDSDILNNRHAVIPYRSLVILLEAAASSLRCADFGMRLAKAQGGVKVLGPLEYAMRNSPTVREAFRYCAKYIQVYGTASQLRSKPGFVPDALFFHLRMLVSRLPAQPQNIERVLLLTQDIALTISHEKVRANEVWLTHAPVSHPDRYRDYFGAEVRFGQSMNGIFFSEHDLDLPIPSVDEQVYEISTAFIQKNFPLNRGVLTTRVRASVERLLSHRTLSLGAVASLLGLRCRTLQRHLRAEGESLESIQDSVRRDVALRYLKHSTLPLYRIARLLGYADTSILSRSCQRWFSLSATEIRVGARQSHAPTRFASVSAT